MTSEQMQAIRARWAEFWNEHRRKEREREELQAEVAILKATVERMRLRIQFLESGQ